MKTFTADRRKSVCHIEEGQDTRASKTQKGSINNESKGRETNDESRRAARCKGTPLRSNAAHCLLGSDQEPFMRWRNGEYQTQDEAVLHGELVGGNSTQRLKVVVRIRPAENASAAR